MAMGSLDEKNKSILTRDLNMMPRYSRYSRFGVRMMSPSQSLMYVLIMGGIILAFVIFTIVHFTSPPSVTQSTRHREAYSGTSEKPEKLIYSDKGLLQNEYTVTGAMQQFYDKTGIYPVLYFTEFKDKGMIFFKEDMDEYAKDAYEEVFDDEKHLMIMVIKRNGSYYIGVHSGTDTRDTLDTEALTIIKETFTKDFFKDPSEVRYKDQIEKINDDESLQKAFADAADNIMTTPFRYKIVVGVAIFGVVGIILLIISRRRPGRMTAQPVDDPVFDPRAKNADDLPDELSDQPIDHRMW